MKPKQPLVEEMRDILSHVTPERRNVPLSGFPSLFGDEERKIIIKIAQTSSNDFQTYEKKTTLPKMPPKVMAKM